MKDKLAVIKSNLMILYQRIDELECSEDINYELFQKVEKINEKLGEVEMLIKEIEEL